MLVSDLIAAMERIAPSSLAESWDNVGLILGDPQDGLSGPVLLTIDLTGAVVDEAIEIGAGAIVAYHPPIFREMRSLTPSTAHGRALLGCARSGMAIYSPHTALDAAEDGVADWLLDQVGATSQRAALSPSLRPDPNQTHKLVVFVPVDPPDLLPKIRASLSDVGAGVIGQYSQCGWSTPGEGSFLGSGATQPAVGASGRLETVHERRLEMVCPRSRLADILRVLNEVHPYEEPAFDLYELARRPSAGLGAGRVATLITPKPAQELAKDLKAALHVKVVHVAATHDRPIKRVAVCPGAGEGLLDDAVHQDASLFVTGEMKHHSVLDALERGISVILAGHTETERGFLPVLAGLLGENDPSIEGRVSQADRPPLRST